MRRYANSKMRVGLWVVLIVAGVAAISPVDRVGAQTAAAPGTTAIPAPNPNASAKPLKKPSIWSLVMDNRDPVFFTIVALSIVGLTLIIQGVLQNRESVMIPRQSTDTIRELISQRRFQELIDFTETDTSFVSKALNPALKRAPSFASMREAMETAVGEQTAEQFRRIEYLNIIGNLGPLLGLLGTVLGMIDAFSAMQAQHGQANPADLAGGISKALVHTMLGLMLAVPCLAAFGVLRTVVDRLTVRGALIAEDLLLMIKPADARPPAAPMPPMARPTVFPPPATAAANVARPQIPAATAPSMPG